jgi:hypothetical protein
VDSRAHANGHVAASLPPGGTESTGRRAPTYFSRVATSLAGRDPARHLRGRNADDDHSRGGIHHRNSLGLRYSAMEALGALPERIVIWSPTSLVLATPCWLPGEESPVRYESPRRRSGPAPVTGVPERVEQIPRAVPLKQFMS